MKIQMTNNSAVLGLMSAFPLLVVLLVVLSLGCDGSETSVASSSPSELAQEVRLALAEPYYVDRNARLASAMRQLTADNVDSVVGVYSELLKDLGQSELEPLFDAWARFDAPAGFAYALDVPFEPAAEFAQKAASYSWAARDVLAARVAVEEAAAERPRKAMVLYKSMIEGWAMSGQDGLDDFILRGPSASDPGQLILAAQPKIYLRDGIEGLLEWSESMIRDATEYAARMKSFRYAVRTAAYRDPRAAIPFVLRHYGEEYASEGPRVLVEKWMETDTEAALAWLRTEAPEEARADALGMAATSWLHRDPNSARAWIDSLPLGDPYYQPAFDRVAIRMSKRDPAGAVEWCHRGQPPELNSTCLRQVAINWYRKDPVAAGVWMEEESGLSAEDMHEVRERGRKKSPKPR